MGESCIEKRIASSLCERLACSCHDHRGTTNVSPCSQRNGFPLMIGGAATAERMIKLVLDTFENETSTTAWSSTGFAVESRHLVSSSSTRIPVLHQRLHLSTTSSTASWRRCGQNSKPGMFSLSISTRRIGTVGRGSCRRRSSSSGQIGLRIGAAKLARSEKIARDVMFFYAQKAS